MRVLIIKTSSLGDVIHTLPAVTDACQQHPGLKFDWVVEDAFAEIPSWHTGVKQVIPVSLRKWRKRPWQAWRSGAWGRFREQLRSQYYDQVIDAQGLIKSAFLTWQARGLRVGLDQDSAREPLASHAYQEKIHVEKNQHAVERTRALFAQALGYERPNTPPDYGLSSYTLTTLMPARPTLIFFHGTTWETKLWPESFWLELAKLATSMGFRVRLPWGNAEEHARAGRIAKVHTQVSVMPATNLQSLASELSTAVAVVGVDTGLAHLAAALKIPSVTLYGPTNPKLTGTYGPKQVHLCSQFTCAPCLNKHCQYQQASAVTPACFAELSPEYVWEQVLDVMAKSD